MRKTQKRKRNFNLQNFRIWEKRLRYPLGATFFAIYMICVYFFYQNEVVYLPHHDTPIHLYSNQTGDDLRQVIKEAMKQAKESIMLMIFSLTDNELIDMLRKKSEEGVEVHIIQDAIATPDIAWKLGPKVKIHKRRDKGLMHQKLLVIDHKQVWLGSTNFTRESLQLHANLLVGILSPELSYSIEKKAADIFANKRIKTPIIKIEGKENIDFYFLPDQPEALDHLIKTINTAKKTVKVAMYTFTHPLLAQALVDAHKRGVDVDVVIDSDSAKQTSKKVFVQLKREGVPVSISARTGLLHYKLMIVDDEMLVAGSANWTKAAFTSNDDNISFIYPLTEEQKKMLDALWSQVKKESKPSFTSSRR